MTKTFPNSIPVESLYYGIAVYEKGKILFANEAAARILGHDSVDSLIEKPSNHIIHRDPGIKSRKVKYGDERSFSLSEESWVRIDGKMIEVEVVTCLVEYQGNDVTQIMFSDITDRKRTERDLKASEERYRILFDNVPIPIAITNSEGEFIIANNRIVETSGYTTTELQSINADTLYADPDTRIKILEKLELDGYLRDYEAVLRRKDGSRYIALIDEDILVLGGEIVNLATIRDITRQRVAD